MWNAVRFWLDMGVDGFRLDAIGAVFEHPEMPPHTLSLAPEQLLSPTFLPVQDFRELMRHQSHQPGMHELMKELRVLVDEYDGDRVLLGEDEDVAFHGNGDDELHLVFNFPLMRIDRMTPAHVRSNQAERLAALPESAWPCNTLGNHDGRRVWSRYGDGVHDAALARLHIALMATLRGTPVLYNGEEIGMTDLELTELGQFRDTAALAQYRLLTGVKGLSPQEALASIKVTTRDRCRNPMQWSQAPNAGFSPPGVAPWLPVNADHANGVNVADQQDNPASLLGFYRRLLALRRATPALVVGDYRALDEGNQQVLTFLRSDAASGQTCLVALNFSSQAQAGVTGLGTKPSRLLFSTVGGRDEDPALQTLQLAPHEVFVAELS
jgi:alpha-glucosidase